MDSKRVYKKISTIFWFMLAILPILLSVFSYVITGFTHTDSLTSTGDIVYIKTYFTFGRILGENVSYFEFLVPPFIKSMFVNLFTSFNITGSNLATLAILFGWFCWVYFLELMVDFIIWLPRWMHDILDKGVGKID